MSAVFSRPKICLALGAGGPKGLAHIGVIKALEKHKIPIDFITGCSAGALIGGYYAAKKNLQEMENLALNHNWRQYLVDFSFRIGINRNQKINSFLQESFGDIQFKDLKIPFYCVATDIKTGLSVVFHQGKVITGIRASISIPLVFAPVINNEQILVDGAVSEPVPVALAKATGADIIIAVNLTTASFNPYISSKPNFYQIAYNSIGILLFNLAKKSCFKADVTITPNVTGIGWRKLFDKKNNQEIIASGETATELAIPKIKALIGRNKPLVQRLFDFLGIR